jgi:hypothetical protein
MKKEVENLPVFNALDKAIENYCFVNGGLKGALDMYFPNEIERHIMTSSLKQAIQKAIIKDNEEKEKQKYNGKSTPGNLDVLNLKELTDWQKKSITSIAQSLLKIIQYGCVVRPEYIYCTAYNSIPMFAIQYQAEEKILSDKTLARNIKTNYVLKSECNGVTSIDDLKLRKNIDIMSRNQITEDCLKSDVWFNEHIVFAYATYINQYSKEDFIEVPIDVLRKSRDSGLYATKKDGSRYTKSSLKWNLSTAIHASIIHFVFKKLVLQDCDMDAYLQMETEQNNDKINKANQMAEKMKDIIADVVAEEESITENNIISLEELKIKLQNCQNAEQLQEIVPLATTLNIDEKTEFRILYKQKADSLRINPNS